MSDVTIEVRDDGSYQVEVPVPLLDGEGNALPLQAGERVELFRCGHSEVEAALRRVHRRVGSSSRVHAPGLGGTEEEAGDAG